jgi:hypothetical protein
MRMEHGMATKVFISFDYDNDKTLKEFLVGQSNNDDSPFEISDSSISAASTDWRSIAERRIKACDVVAVICGKNTNTASGVSEEIELARGIGRDYFLLAGYSDGENVKPLAATSTDKVYKWTWDNLKELIGGAR